MSDSIEAINPVGEVGNRDVLQEFESLENQNKSLGDRNFALDAIDLMFGAENIHNNRLADLDKQHTALSEKISAIKSHLEEIYNHMKSGSEEPLNLEDAKTSILALWEEWREELKASDLSEFQSLKVELDKLDFSDIHLTTLEKELIPELEKIQRHHEFKFQQIPSKLRMFLELFSILVEILKEVPKKEDEAKSLMNKNSTRGS